MAARRPAAAACSVTPFSRSLARISTTFERNGSASRRPRASGRSMRWQREMIVGSSCSGCSVSSRKSVCGGGSSSVLRNAFALSVLRRSAPYTTPAFQPPWNAVCPIGSIMRVRIASTEMMRLFFSGARRWMSGCARRSPFPYSSFRTRSASSPAMPRTPPTTR